MIALTMEPLDARPANGPGSSAEESRPGSGDGAGALPLGETTAELAKPRAGRGRRTRGFRPLPYLLVLPLLLFIVVLGLYPTLLTFIESFVHINPLSPPEHFVGLQNYRDIFADPDVITSWANTILYVLFGVILSTLLALFIAVNLTSNFLGRAVVLAIVILPWALPGVVEGIIWSWMYDPAFGVLNSVLKSLHLIPHYQLWISGNRASSIFFIELVQVWQITPLSAILILASLQSIPTDIYEAATVEGASAWRRLRSITFPLIRPGLTVAIVQAFIQCINVFDQVYVLNANALTGRSIMLQTYLTTFQNLNFGQGYALSFLVTAATMIVSLGILRFLYKQTEY
jgi:multiple sugar transport system permease protein